MNREFLVFKATSFVMDDVRREAFVICTQIDREWYKKNGSVVYYSAQIIGKNMVFVTKIAYDFNFVENLDVVKFKHNHETGDQEEQQVEDWAMQAIYNANSRLEGSIIRNDEMFNHYLLEFPENITLTVEPIARNMTDKKAKMLPAAPIDCITFIEDARGNTIIKLQDYFQFLVCVEGSEFNIADGTSRNNRMAASWGF